ncbi:phosphoribosyl-AMP cyclohydrolase [Croceicoccus naphthovorans]|uniref:Histidine biosynthesis bifunctional protein HisIE n=1 Tax=Croceicoccus naphthovorans TaxID=1348774 RepID=A0A0G3XLG6_9SPHN|nr:phosphoribosyl-AMP cyclohydrolase [Croceicoccus naphthovorans]
MFALRTSVEQVELGGELAPRFDADGLMPAIVVDVETKKILMLGYMNADALEQTILKREAHFWSRSRKALWRKGEHSGFTQHVESILIDDDQDALILHVVVNGPGSCHVGFRSCFYRELELPDGVTEGPVGLRCVEDVPAFDAGKIYEGLANPTQV